MNEYDYIKEIYKNKYSVEEIWDILRSNPCIAGPWTPHYSTVTRYNIHGQPIARASSQEEVIQKMKD